MRKNGSNQIESIADLKPDKKNARKHNPRNIGMLTDSIGQVGVGRSGVIDEDGNILVGNGTYEALAELGIEKVKVVKASGNEWVVVQREGLTEEQKVKMALFDNRTAELAEWDIENLGLLDDEYADIFDDIFNPDELAEVLDISPNFLPGDQTEQGKLDEKQKIVCPECGHSFHP